MTDGRCTMHRHIQHQREHTDAQTRHAAPQTSGRPRDTRARTDAALAASHTSPRRVEPSAAGWEKVAAHLACFFINTNLSMNACTLLLPLSGRRARRIGPLRWTFTRPHRGSSDARAQEGGGGDCKVRESRGCPRGRLQRQLPGTRTGRGHIGSRRVRGVQKRGRDLGLQGLRMSGSKMGTPPLEGTGSDR